MRGVPYNPFKRDLSLSHFVYSWKPCVKKLQDSLYKQETFNKNVHKPNHQLVENDIYKRVSSPCFVIYVTKNVSIILKHYFIWYCGPFFKDWINMRSNGIEMCSDVRMISSDQVKAYAQNFERNYLKAFIKNVSSKQRE